MTEEDEEFERIAKANQHRTFLSVKQGADYERGFVDGAQHQMKSSVDLALEAMRIKKWVGLTAKEKHEIRYSHMTSAEFIEVIEAKLRSKNNG